MADLKNTNINDTGFLKLPVGTEAQKPGNSQVGMVRWSTDRTSIEGYDGNEWKRFELLAGGLYEFSTATFTNGGQTGTSGPNLTQARNGLSGPGTELWKNNTQFFNTSNGIQLWTVPANGTYRITAAGARSGDFTSFGNNGRGARIQGEFQLTEGEIIRILVGQEGQGGGGFGGGGGTFVVRSPYNTLASCIIAAGGAGGTHPGQNPTLPQQHGQTTENGHPGITATNAPGGSGGNGGGGQGGGGAGFLSNGFQTGGSPSTTSGIGFVNGGQGGPSGRPDGSGGFGGGGGYTNSWGGGGGGHSGGGGGGSSPHQGGGGGSVNRGSNQVNQVGANNGHGFCIIELL